MRLIICIRDVLLSLCEEYLRKLLKRLISLVGVRKRQFCSSLEAKRIRGLSMPSWHKTALRFFPRFSDRTCIHVS